MQTDNLDIIRNYYAAFNAKNWQEMLDLVAEDIVHEPNQGTARHGKSLFQEFVAHMNNCYDETLSDIQLFSGEQEGRIAAEFVVNGIYKKGEEGLPVANGQTYILPAAAFIEVKEQKITRVTTYYNLEKWIELVS
jgi:steroid delta-isomerase-like uncharacterized protein